MSPTPTTTWIQRLRAHLALLRSGAERIRAPRLVARWYRGLSYVLHLLLWSRIAAGRAGAVPVELPARLLRHKGIETPPPRLAASGHAEARVLSDGFAQVHALLFANLRRADLLSSTRHAIPGPAFRGVYLWDSAFIAQVWAWWDPAVAADVLGAVIELRDGDRLQHVVTEFHASRYTQPPLIAWSLQRLLPHVRAGAGESVATALAERHFVPLCAFQRWLDAHRRLDDGLYAWAHPYESGVENAPRFSNADESALRNTAGIGAVDFSCYVVLQLEALAELARRLDLTRAAARYRGDAQALRRRIDALLWDERDGLYYDRDGAGAPVRVATIASLLPLWAGVPDGGRAERMIRRVMAPRGFGTLIPLPSVARDAPQFEPDMWRGPVWLNMAYGVIQGLLRYGRDREAAELAWRLCVGVHRVFERERHIYEFYDPDRHHTRALRRKRGNLWKALTLGTGPQRDFVGWTGLVNNLLLEVLLGLEHRTDGLTLCPRLPAAATGLRLRLELPPAGLQLELSRPAGNRVEGRVARGAHEASFVIRDGQRLNLDAVVDGPTEGSFPCQCAYAT